MTNQETLYKEMYHILCKAQSQALDAIVQGDYDLARPILQRALLEAENRYIFTTEAAETET